MRFFKSPPRPVHLLVVLDASTSMFPYAAQVGEALTQFLTRMAGIGKEGATDYRVTLVQFSSPHAIHVGPRDVSAGEATFAYEPDGGTALWDGIAAGLAALSQVPHRVIAIIATDGEENSSREYTSTRIRAWVDTLRWSGTWSFLWLNMQGSSSESARAVGIECLDFSRADIVDVLVDLAGAIGDAVGRAKVEGTVDFGRFLEASRRKYLT